MNAGRCIFLLIILLVAVSCRAQPREKAQGEFDLHYNKAVAYDELSLFGPCIEELNMAIDRAALHRLEEQRINAVIMLAEIMRKTGDYDKGLDLLASLAGTDSLPQLHVRKLGRIAAIYNERPAVDGIDQQDSVLRYLDIALEISTRLHLVQEEAGLYNELGYTISGKDRQMGLDYLLKSAQLFDNLDDTHNYVGAMTNVLRSYIFLRDTVKADAVIRELLPLVKDRQWYTAEIELYNLVASYYSDLLGDSLAAQQWRSQSDKSRISNLVSINSSQVNAFRTLYETKKLQEALDHQTARSRELIAYLSMLALLVLGVIALLLRERKLKRRIVTANNELQVSNEKYQLLMVESNHRIKNNLQMITSMLQYSAGRDDGSSGAFSRMADKIQTISALHRHLSADAHNELVAIDAYFSGIVARYEKISPALPAITCAAEPVAIRSERIVYFGLILNEMLANTFEHRAPEGNAVTITVKRSGRQYVFDYRDGSSHDPAAKEGTGSTLIRQLIRHIDGSEFRFDPAQGHYQFRFHE